jgi:hemerythrin
MYLLMVYVGAVKRMQVSQEETTMIKFTSDLETKVSKIDEQHKELFDRINKVIALGEGSVTQEETEKTLNLLGDYISEHFRDEEELQRTSGYPQYEWHRGQHKLYVDSFRTLKSEYHKNGPSPAEQINSGMDRKAHTPSGC